IYLPGCPPRPEMLLYAILKLHDKIQQMPQGRQPRGSDPRGRKGRAGCGSHDSDAGHDPGAGVAVMSDSGEEPTMVSPGQGEVIGVRRGMFGVTGTPDTSGYGRLVRRVALAAGTPRPYGGYFDAVV